MAANSTGAGRPRNSALKDSQLTYRACTPGYAESLQLASPSQLVGQSDFDLLSDRSASLVHAAEQRILTSGTTEITAGELLSKRTAGKYFVRSPVINRAGHICGIEVSVVSVEELHRSYQLLLGTELQLRNAINFSPFGLLIHRNCELIYVNTSWLELMGNASALPGAEEIRRLVPGGVGESRIIRSVNSDGVAQDLRLQSRVVRWNGSDAIAVYCVSGAPPESNILPSDENANFVEKRHGHRRSVEISPQPEVLQRSELEQSVARLQDYLSAAGDFNWEMDGANRMTHISMEMKEFLGVETARLLNIPLEKLIPHHVHEDDQPEWKVLLVDMNKQLPFRDREYIWQRKDGEKRVVRLSGVPVFNAEEEFIGYRGIGWDCTAQHHSASIVAYHASHDSLTGLVNRREFESRCNDAITRTAEANQALCFIDLDNFKRVNDTAGHLAGDELLRQLSTLFTGLVRRSDVLARLGGDEFGLLIYGVGLKEALRLATQLRAEVEGFQFHWEGKQFSVGASIGLVMVDERWSTRSALFGAADAACYDAKHQGRNRVAVFDDTQDISDRKQGEQQWDAHIKNAIEQRKVKLAMQKIASTDKLADSHSKIEILVRLPSPDGELLLPDTVLPVARRFGLSVALDEAIIESTIDWLERQPHVTDGLDLCCVNLSGAAVDDEKFLSFLLKALKSTSIDPSILCFEINESAVSTSLTAVSRFMEKLGVLGCRFAIDDFSGAIHSFDYLRKLPVGFVKINSTYVRAILEDPVHFAMVRSINDVAQALGKQTIAESVESADVLNKLRDLGVNLVQGYHVAAPEIIDF